MSPSTAKRTPRDVSLSDDEAPLRKKAQLARDVMNAYPISGDDRKFPETDEEWAAYEVAKAKVIEQYHDLYSEIVECHRDLVEDEFMLHDQAKSFVELTKAVLSDLNDDSEDCAQRRLPRLSIKDLGQPKLDELIDVQLGLFRFQDEFTDIAARIRDAILVQCGSPVDDIRLGLTKCAERMQEAAEAAGRTISSFEEGYVLNAENIEVAEDWCEECVEAKSKLIKEFVEVVREWRRILVQTKPAIEILKRQYRNPRTPVEQDEYYVLNEKDEGDPSREDVAGPLARSIVVAYATLKTKYEAAFLRAVALAPLTFAYSAW
ncbi:hypothetical protein LTR27_009936 [Elasticomyces elasticus]|nr:hypothetical protein LTR27_009936 [Elasticomyces elasticus]